MNIKKLLMVAVSAGHLFSFEDPNKVDIAQKLKTAEDLVAKAINYLEESPVQVAFRAFQHDSSWRRGEMQPFVINQDAYMVVNADEQLIWQDVSTLTSIGKVSLFEEMQGLGQDGGWVNYIWNNALFHAYVRTTTKDNQTFIIGVGFYPEDQKFTAQYLVNHIIELCQVDGCRSIFKALKDNDERVVFGPVGLWIMDDSGTVRSCSSDSCKTGKKLLWQDTILNGLGDNDEAWINDFYNGANRTMYVKRFNTDEHSYIIGAHFYDDIDQDSLKSLVKRTAQYIKLNAADVKNGLIRAPSSDFIKGSMGAIIFDDNNNLIMDYRDKNMSSPLHLDEIRSIIGDEPAKFVQIYQRRAYKNIYIERVVTQYGVFFVAAGAWDLNKAHNVHSMVNRAVETLNVLPLSQALATFSEGNSDFLRGDISIAVYTHDGTTLVDGINKNQIWKNCKDQLDDNGRNIFDTMLTDASDAGSWVDSPMHQANRRIFVKLVTLPYQISDTSKLNGSEMVVTEEDPAIEEYKNSTIIVASHYYL